MSKPYACQQFGSVYNKFLDYLSTIIMSADRNDDSKYKYNLLENVGKLVEQPCPEGKSYLTRGDYSYFHYACDGVNDAVRIHRDIFILMQNCTTKICNLLSTAMFSFPLDFYWFIVC